MQDASAREKSPQASLFEEELTGAAQGRLALFEDCAAAINQLFAQALEAKGPTAFDEFLGFMARFNNLSVYNAMLVRGRVRLLDKGYMVPAVQCDAEKLPFPDDWFDCVTVAFGLRNMTHKDAALAEMRRVLRPGGRLLVLEFSRVWKPLAPLYDFYSFQVIPRIGKLVTNDEDSYRYLSESIRVHPGQEELKAMMEAAGLEQVEYFNLTLGVVALHRGYKF